MTSLELAVLPARFAIGFSCLLAAQRPASVFNGGPHGLEDIQEHPHSKRGSRYDASCALIRVPGPLLAIVGSRPATTNRKGKTNDADRGRLRTGLRLSAADADAADVECPLYAHIRHGGAG